MIIDIKDTMADVGADFYNGGWVKKLDGIDESKENGYKYKGEFLPKRSLEGLHEYVNGNYLVCSLEGSRTNHIKYIWLIRINDHGIDFYHEEPFEGNDWALQILPLAKKVLMVDEEKKQNPLEDVSDERLIDELKRRGFEVTALRSII